MDNKRLLKAFTGIIMGFLLLSTNSCIDDDWDFSKISDEIEITPGIAAPMAYGILSIEDLLREFDTIGRVKQFDDSLLYLTYVDSLFSFPASEIINIPDQIFPEIYISSDINIPEWLLSGIGDTINFHKEKKEEFIFENNERPDSIKIKTTNIHIHIESSFKHTGKITITSDNILIDGQNFKETIQISDASGNFSYDAEIPVDGAMVTLDNSEPGKTTLPFKYALQLKNSGAAISTDETCSIAISMNNIEFSAVYGFLGDHELLLNSGKIDIDLYDNSPENGNILFADPRIRISTNNSYGVPVSIELSDVFARSEKNNMSTPLTFNGINPFDVSSPGFGQIGQSVETLMEINKENSNIEDAMATDPESFNYKVKAITNPGIPSTSNNFVTDSSNLKISIDVLLPLWIKAEGFILEDTLDWDFEKEFSENTDIIEYLRLGMEAKNKIPMQTNLQVFFTDENYVVLDSLFHDSNFLLKGAELDANDKVTNAIQEEKSIEISTARIDKIKPTKKLLVRATINSKDAELNKYVKYYSYYTLDFKLNLSAKLKINTRDL